MIRFAKSRLSRIASIAVPAALGLAFAGATALGTTPVASASATTPTALVVTSSSTAPAVALTSAPGVQIVEQVPSSLTQTPAVVVVVGFGPSALAGVDAKIRAVAPSTPIVAVSLPYSATPKQVDDAVNAVLAGFAVSTK